MPIDADASGKLFPPDLDPALSMMFVSSAWPR